MFSPAPMTPKGNVFGISSPAVGGTVPTTPLSPTKDEGREGRSTYLPSRLFGIPKTHGVEQTVYDSPYYRESDFSNLSPPSTPTPAEPVHTPTTSKLDWPQAPISPKLTSGPSSSFADSYGLPGNLYSKSSAIPSQSPSASRKVAVRETPPVRSLYEELQAKDRPILSSLPEGRLERSSTSIEDSSAAKPSKQSVAAAPVSVSSSLSLVHQEYDERWVTVFGFPINSSATVLRHFQAYGSIVKHVQEVSHGNWMHIMYQTKLQAQNALSKNGKIIQGTIMIGVIPCTASIAKGTRSSLHATKKKLTVQAGQEPMNLYAVPRAQSSFLSKVAEYIFGL